MLLPSASGLLSLLNSGNSESISRYPWGLQPDEVTNYDTGGDANTDQDTEKGIL